MNIAKLASQESLFLSTAIRGENFIKKSLLGIYNFGENIFEKTSSFLSLKRKRAKLALVSLLLAGSVLLSACGSQEEKIYDGNHCYTNINNAYFPIPNTDQEFVLTEGTVPAPSTFGQLETTQLKYRFLTKKAKGDPQLVISNGFSTMGGIIQGPVVTFTIKKGEYYYTIAELPGYSKVVGTDCVNVAEKIKNNNPVINLLVADASKN